MIPINKVRDLISRHKQLEKELSSSEIEKKEFAKKSKDYSNLNEIIEIAKKIECYQNNKTDLENIINDDKNERDMIDLAKLELKNLEEENVINEKKLKVFLIPKDEADEKNAIIEIRAGTGGLEASLFASDLFKMYEKVSNKKKMENGNYKYIQK